MGLKVNTIFNTTAEEGLKELDSDSIDLVVTSPPYDKIRSYKSAEESSSITNCEFSIDIVVEELWRVVKIGGIVVWIVNDQTEQFSESGSSFTQALMFKDKGFKLYDTMIFKKINPPPLTHRRYEQYFEYIFVFSKAKPKTTNIMVETCKYAGKSRVGNTYRHTTKDELYIQHNEGDVSEYKIRSNIFEYMVGKDEAYRQLVKRDHPAKFPLLLARDQILSWSNKGDIILDPFSGSGTTAIVAMLTERNYIGFEKNKAYYDNSKIYIKIVEKEIKDCSKVIRQFNKAVSEIKYKKF